MHFPSRLILVALLWMPLAASAEVQPSLEVQTYPVNWQAGTPLREIIGAASPVRHEGKVFHGFTRWRVDWQLWWLEAPDGRSDAVGWSARSDLHQHDPERTG